MKNLIAILLLFFGVSFATERVTFIFSNNPVTINNSEYKVIAHLILSNEDNKWQLLNINGSDIRFQSTPIYICKRVNGLDSCIFTTDSTMLMRLIYDPGFPLPLLITGSHWIQGTPTSNVELWLEKGWH
ncbi:MAG: hypothetical protein M0R17_01010 [Candidatus Omnitrophica bacterium]|jgi:hypothetical protein|nr:hypothetical protein [Candidatus Omnitrophota bacterium]